MDWTLALFAVALLIIIWVFCINRGDTRQGFAPESPLRLQVDTRKMGDESAGYLRANFVPNYLGRGGNWTPWRHERGNTYYYWYDAPQKTPGFECLDACYHRYDRVGCTNACRNIFNVA